MKTKKLLKAITAAIALLLLLTVVLIVYSRNDSAAQPDVPAVNAAPVGQTAPAETPEVETGSGMRDGERFETTIILEGMESTVKYEHVRNDAIGFEMDYDYELFARQSGADSERFVSVYDRSEEPENYLELRYDPRDAETVAEALGAVLSREYDLLESTRELERAGSCIRIEASELKGTGRMADQIKVAYIIPASDGCRVAAAHYAAEAAEGFGRRFSYLLNTLSVIAGNGDGKLSDELALSAIKRYCYAQNAELEAIVKAGEYPVYWELASSDENEIVVLYRSYTGAQIRYHIDPVSGETCVTESVPAVSSEETRTDEVLNVRDYTV